MQHSGRVTMKDVAKVADVSVRTVSNVVNDYQFVSDEKRSRVKKAIKDLGYIVNASARNLRRGRTGNIVLAVPDLTMPYFADLANQIITEAHKQGFNVLVEPTLSDSDEESAALARIHANIADGIIFCPVASETQTFSRLNLGVPVVILSEPTSKDTFDHISIDNEGAAYAATKYLIDRGCTQIAAIGIRNDQVRDGTASKRLLGYQRALRDAGLPINEKLERRTDEWHRSDGARAIRDLLTEGNRIDGAFAFTDQIAAGVLYELSSRGLNVPKNVAVVGFDNNNESQFFIPSLTTIDPGICEIAHRAVQLLNRRIDEQGVQSSRNSSQAIDETVPFSLIRRESA